MKKLFLFLIIVVASFTVNAQQKQIIKTNPFMLSIGNFNGSYETVLNSKSSVIISGSYIYGLFGEDINIAGFGLAYRYYITHAKKVVPTGFYVNPEISSYFNSYGFLFGIGAELGYQWAWESGFVLDLGIGPMLRFGGSGGDYDFFGGSPITPTATIAIGYAF